MVMAFGQWVGDSDDDGGVWSFGQWSTDWLRDDEEDGVVGAGDRLDVEEWRRDWFWVATGVMELGGDGVLGEFDEGLG